MHGPQQAEPVEVRHHQVEHHAVGHALAEQGKRLDPVRRETHVEAHVLEGKPEHHPDVRVVIDDEDLGHV